MGRRSRLPILILLLFKATNAMRRLAKACQLMGISFQHVIGKLVAKSELGHYILIGMKVSRIWDEFEGLKLPCQEWILSKYWCTTGLVTNCKMFIFKGIIHCQSYVPPNIPPIKQGLVLFVPDQARIPSSATVCSRGTKSPGAGRGNPVTGSQLLSMTGREGPCSRLLFSLVPASMSRGLDSSS